MPKLLRLVVPLFALLGCGSQRPTLSISADPVTVELGACTFTTLRVTGTLNGNPLIEGSQPVTLTTDYGSFEQAGDCSDSTQDVRTKSDIEVSGHTVTVRVFGDDIPPNDGFAHVTARAVDGYGNEATATIQINFRPAGNASHLEFSCATYNIGALASSSTSMEIPCTVSVTDDADETVVGAQVHFLTEAGRMANDSGQLVYQPHGVGSKHAAPQDVEVLEDSAEPYRTTSDGKVHNPRDGLVTVVAWVLASKDVTDLELLSEPYVDWNDNGVYDPGEPYLNLNGNDQWDELQSEDPARPHALWKKIKILWTGSLQSEPPVASVDPPFSDLLYESAANITFILADENFNVLAANDSSDSITWTTSPAPDITVTSTNPMPLRSSSDARQLGMLLDDNFDFLAPDQASSWMIGASAGVTVQNTMVCRTPLTAESFTVQGTVTQTLSLTAQGDPGERDSSSTLTLNGTLEPPICAN